MRARLTAIIGIAFCAGALTTTWATRGAHRVPERSAAEILPLPDVTDRPIGSIGWDEDAARGRTDRSSEAAASSSGGFEPIEMPRDEGDTGGSPPGGAAGAPADLMARDLLLPVDGVRSSDLHPSFDEARGARMSMASCARSPRGTPVRAADAGRIAKLFVSERGGNAVYQFDAAERYCYYYAHLDRYASDLTEGQQVGRGDIIGYVGTSGNAPPNTPHLHFAIFRLGPEKRWWEGEPIDPFALLR